ncbi:MAG: tetratricopeptide repeat protein [Saprospiraceae bacterium]|nr:tetratricopeptide repeat protein [Saprospiraceae bacterium]
MKILLLVCLLLPCWVVGQIEKGATPFPTQNKNVKTNSATRAVVIGISDYQNPQIPDLRFADRDATAFADWLRSPAGGSVPESRLQVLLNADATAGKIIAALGGLVADCRPGDLALIYFSGHGDVERISKFQRGFWLSWDSPPSVYAAGACALAYLQDIITTLSESGVQVVVVADACRAGKLAGSAVNGTQATSAALAQQFANEVKILSCQPEEYSLEGEQWGGGRGAFSFHLIDALYGLADANADGTVNLLELGRYLEDRVPAETAPHTQIPFTVGGKATLIARVDPVQMALWKDQKAGAGQAFAKIDARGLEELALSDADSTIQALYSAFTAALHRGDLLEARDGVGPTADSLYKLLIREPTLAELHGLMTRNFAAALMDKGQQVLNQYLSGDLRAFDVLENEIGINYRLLANQFFRAAELLGDRHYYYKNLHAKGLYFESYAVYDWDIPGDSARLLDIKLLKQAAAEDSTAAFAWLNLCWLETSADSLAYYVSRLENVVPNWPIFHYVVGCQYLSDPLRNPEMALSRLQRAIELDSTFVPAWYMSSFPLTDLGRQTEATQNRETAMRIGIQKMEENPAGLSDIDWEMLRMGYYDPKEKEMFDRILQQYVSVDSFSVHRWKNYAMAMRLSKRYTEAEWAYHKMILLDSLDTRAWNGLAWLYFAQGKFAEMEKASRRCTALAPKAYESWNGLGWALLRQQQLAEAEQVFLKALEKNKKGVAAWNGLGQIYLKQKRYAEAIHARRRYTELSPDIAYGWSSLGQVYAEAGNFPEAEAAYLMAIQKDSTVVNFFNSLALVYSNSGKYAEMAAVCRRSIALDSTKYTGWNNLGFALLQTGQYAEAETALIRAIAINPESVHVHKNLGTWHFRMGHRTEAKEAFEKALALDPDHFGGYLGMAYLLQAENKHHEALQQVELALQKKATFEQLERDTDLAPLRALPDWKNLMIKYFPDKVSD